MSNTNMQPVYILPEDTRRTTGRDAQRNNIFAAKAVAQTVRTTLGPKGMDKMIVDSDGNITVSNDGVTILTEMQIEHPAAKMVVEIAKTQEEVVGDGTTTAVVLAGELLKKAEDFLDQNVHPTVIARGYRLAEQEAQRLLPQMARKVNVTETKVLKNIAETAMTGKGAEAQKEHLTELLLEAVQRLAGSGIERDALRVERQVIQGASELIAGLVLDKERVHPAMPIIVSQATIALLDVPLEIKNTEVDAKIQITDPHQLTAFLEQEENLLQSMVEQIRSTGAKVVFCQRGIDDTAQYFLAQAGIMAVRRVKKSDMEALSKVTGGKIISSWKALTSRDLGQAGLVQEKKIGEEQMIFVEQCLHPQVVTLLVKGSTIHVAEEMRRAVRDAWGDLAAALKDGLVVAGAGAVEIELCRGIRSFAKTLQGKEQLAVQAFAESLEIIPKTLAENAGLDSLEMITHLHAAHDRGEHFTGINVFTGKMMDAWEAGVIEPLRIKTQALTSATEVAEMILRIDDVILGKKNEPLRRQPAENID